MHRFDAVFRECLLKSTKNHRQFCQPTKSFHFNILCRKVLEIFAQKQEMEITPL